MVSGQGIDVLNGHSQVVESDGHDVTQPYVLAAWLALKTAQSQGCRFAVMTDGTPSCGSQNVYNGASSGVKVPGEGVAAALLRQHGIENPRVLGSIPGQAPLFRKPALEAGFCFVDQGFYPPARHYRYAH